MHINNGLAENFTLLFQELSVPAMLVAEDSQLLAVNEAACDLFMLDCAELTGQLWAGLDAQLTLISWRGRWKSLRSKKIVRYETDIVTSREYLRPVTVEVVHVAEDKAIVHLRDRVPQEIVASELTLVEETHGVGTWSYNRITGKVNFSDLTRKLLAIPAELSSSKEVIASLRDRMSSTDWEELSRLAVDLLEDSGHGTHTTYLRNAGGTTRLSLAATSVANPLHVTHLFGIVKEGTDPQDLLDAPLPESLDASSHISSELARFSIDQAQDIIFWTGPEGQVFYVNKAVERSLGYTLEELQEVSVLDFVEDFDQTDVQSLWTQLRQNTSLEAEYSLRKKDGEKVEILAVINYFRFGNQEYACSFCRDITKRKRAERRRLLTEFTVDTAQDMIFWSRPTGELNFANSTLLELTGYSAESFAELTVAELLPQEEAERFASSWARIRSGEDIVYATVIRKKDGTTIPVEATLNYLNFEGDEYNLVYLRDVRRRKARELQLELSRLALDTAADCILWLDRERRVTYANQTLLNLVGARGETGKSAGAFLTGVDLATIEPGSTQNFQLLDHRGVTHQFNLSCSSVRKDGAEYLMLIGRDIGPIAERQREIEEAYREINELKNRLEEENVSLRQDAETKYNINNIITVSTKYQQVLRQVGQVADTDTTVLIIGETGTGKELLARAVHQLSRREEKPMVKVNCAALPASLIESELFGHEKGAFTGAVKRKKGRFELADGGTIFLDEIGEMPLELQAKLLRALQEGEFERVGGTETIKVDVRLVAATNRDLRKMIRKGKFREDLFYRLNVFPIVNPPLRDRPEDIPVLVEYFTRKFARSQGKDIKEISSADLKKLQSYPFPGNIRELENLIERSVVLCQGETLYIALDAVDARKKVRSGEAMLTFEQMQRRHIIRALKRTGGRITGAEGAGRLLGLNDRTLMSKMRKMGIEKHEYIVAE